MSEKVFADGLIAKYPKEKAPSFVVAHISIKGKELIAFIEKHQKTDGWLNLDLLKSKDGQKMYAVLNEWKPEKKEPNKKSEEISATDIPW
jgi:hypothetical protein